MSKATKIEVSTWSLVKVVLVILAVYFLFLIRSVAVILFVSVILAAAFQPIVEWLVRKKIPRLLAVLAIFVLLLSLVSLVIVLLLPPTAVQIQNLAADFPVYWQKISVSLQALENYSQNYGVTTTVQSALGQLQSVLSTSGRGVLDTLVNIFGGIVSFFVILIISFYLLLEESASKKVLRFIVPARYQPYIMHLLLKMRDKIGLWLRGQIVLSLILGSLVFIGLKIFGIFIPVFGKYALVLAFLAFLLEFIPYFGPTLSAIPSLFIGLTQGLQAVIAILIFYSVVQWCESHIIAPQVMKRAVGLNPVIVIVALLIGHTLGGIIGTVLAIPVTTAIFVLIEEVSREIDQRGVET